MTTAISNGSDLSRQRPDNLDQAVVCMQEALDYFHEERDKRAIFLRLYYIMTREVQAAVHQVGDYQGKQIFLDPDWIVRLSGIFSSMYFSSLDTSDRPEEVERAWKIAHATAGKERSTVTQNALLGITAHIMYDLPRAIAQNLAEHGDLGDESTLRRRKFDHDQVNNLLVRSINPIQEVLGRDYGPGIRFLDRTLGRMDERLSKIGLKHYRERVWWDALTFAAAAKDGDEAVVLEKLNWESYKIAQTLTGGSFWQRAVWFPEKAIGLVVPRRRFGPADLEPAGGFTGRPSAVLNPFQ